MFCPVCKAEYREGFTRCSDCDVDLVDTLPEEPEEEIDPDAKFVEVLRTRNSTDIVLIESILDSADLHYYIRGGLMRFIDPLDDAILMVLDEDAETAVELLKDAGLSYQRFIFGKQ